MHVTNQNFLDGGGSPFEGQERPLCTDKLVTLRNAQAVAPNFNLFTDVPMPTHFWGLTINDLGLSLDKRSVEYGEAQGLPFVPMGIYDWAGRLVDTVQTDFNGFYEALEPSTRRTTARCRPGRARTCTGSWATTRAVPGHLNPDYNPRFRTIATNFQAWPGLYTVTDTAPTQVAPPRSRPAPTQVDRTMCDLDPAQPQPLALDRPYIRRGDTSRADHDQRLRVRRPKGQVLLNGQPTGVPSWTRQADHLQRPERHRVRPDDCARSWRATGSRA